MKSKKRSRPVLMDMVINSDIEGVRSAISNGCDVNERDANGESALHHAVRAWSIDLVRLLLESGADCDLQDLHGNTPLFRALFESRGRDGIVELLLDAGADMHLRNDHGVSPYSLAETVANYDLMKFFKGRNHEEGGA